MAGDLPDWTEAPASQMGAIAGNGVYLNGTASIGAGPIVTTTFLVPAGKTFYCQGVAYGVIGPTGLLSNTLQVVDNFAIIMVFVTAGGFALIFDTPIPFAAGHTFKLFYRQATHPPANFTQWG